MTKLPFSGLEVFLAIAECGSLSAAARVLGVGSPAVSQQLRSLEASLGVSLFIRTTRSVQLTDAGRVLLERGAPALIELEEVLRDVQGSALEQKGTLRITLPYGAFRIALAHKLRAFRDAYPAIEVELSFNEAFVDLASERFHAGIRLGGAVQGDMIAVRLTPPLVDAYFATPSYLEANGRPRTPHDLLEHNCIRYRYIKSRKFYEWTFRRKRKTFTVDVQGSLIVNSFDAAMEAARQGLGIAQNFREEVGSDIEAGLLETILDPYALERPGFYLYYPREYARLGILKSFVAFIRL